MSRLAATSGSHAWHSPCITFPHVFDMKCPLLIVVMGNSEPRVVGDDGAADAEQRPDVRFRTQPRHLHSGPRRQALMLPRHSRHRAILPANPASHVCHPASPRILAKSSRSASIASCGRRTDRSIIAPPASLACLRQSLSRHSDHLSPENLIKGSCCNEIRAAWCPKLRRMTVSLSLFEFMHRILRLLIEAASLSLSTVKSRMLN